MLNIVLIVFFLLLCISVPVGLVVSLISWLVRPRQPTTLSISDELALLRTRLNQWVVAGKLTTEQVAPINALLDAELGLGAAPLPVAAVVPAPVATPTIGVAPAIIPTSTTQRGDLPPPPPPPIGAPTAQRDQFGAALMALRTRRTLLFLGAFLLVISALILVVFNWGSFAPIIQFALLTGVTGGLWGLGNWVSRQEGLARAGVNLEVVASLLVPVVGFSLGRPGLLDLAPRTSLFIASLLSLIVYTIAAWRTDRIAFGTLAPLAGIGSLLFGLQVLPDAWLPTALIPLLGAYLIGSERLRPTRPNLAQGPFWVAHIGLPITIVVGMLLFVSGMMSERQLAVMLWVGAGAYLVAVTLDHRPRWSWVATGLLIGGFAFTLDLLELPATMRNLDVGLAALVALSVAAWLEPRAPRHAQPGYAALLLLGMWPFFTAIESTGVVVWGFPALIVAAWACVALAHRGRFGWMAANTRTISASGALFVGGALLASWFVALLVQRGLGYEQGSLWVLPLAGVAFATAYWWPGRLQRYYDSALQALGSTIIVCAGYVILSSYDIRTLGVSIITVVWLFQTLLRRQSSWASLTLISLQIAVGNAFLQSEWNYATDSFQIAIPLGFALVYTIGGTLVRSSAWRYWTMPGLVLGILSGCITVFFVAIMTIFGHVIPIYAGAPLALAGVSAWLAYQWQRPSGGFAAAPLIVGGLLIAASKGFFISPWVPLYHEYAYLLCAITFGLLCLEQYVRRSARAYAKPYAIVGYLLTFFAIQPSMTNTQSATLTFGALTIFYGAAVWLYGFPWMTVLAYIASDMALLSGAAWLFPAGDPAGSGYILLAATWLQVIGALTITRPVRSAAVIPTKAGSAPDSMQNVTTIETPAYVASLVAGSGALVFASRSDFVLGNVAFGLTILFLVLATIKAHKASAWASLPLLVVSLVNWHAVAGLTWHWSCAWLVAEAFGLILLGWMSERLPQGRAPLLDRWRTVIYAPWIYGPLTIGICATAATLQVRLIGETTPESQTFALATLGLVLATAATRLRSFNLAYAAGAAFVGAGLSQLLNWGFSEAQWYVMPAGIYLLAVGESVRRFQGRRHVAQIIDASALLLMLGTSFGQSLRSDGQESLVYGTLLCSEALVLSVYGTLRKMRAPFFGGIAFFVLGVLWLSVDPLMSANKWVLLGILGIILVGAYVILERYQERLTRAGRLWVEQIKAWG